MPFHASQVALFAAPALIALWTLRGPLRGSVGPSLAAIAYFGAALGGLVWESIRHPHEWDYGCFWLYGHVAAAHANIYDPASFAHVALPFTPSAEFVRTVIGVGFPYPPPSIALFLPLGYIDRVPPGLALWYAVQCVALVAAARILAARFMPDRSWRGAALIAAVVLALPATAANIYDAQTNFLLLLVVALALHAGASPWAGVWKMAACWIKPYAALLLLVDVVRSNRRALLGAVAAAVVSLAGAALLLGPQTVAAYVQSAPTGREPADTFFEAPNVSLLATILRTRHPLPTQVSLAHEPVYLALGVALLVVTIVLVARAPRESDLGLVLSLLTGMLIYPATLFSYGVMLVIPLLVLWQRRARIPGATLGVVALTAIVTFTQSRLPYVFFGNLALWLAVAVLLARSPRDRTPQPIVIAPEPAPALVG